MNFFTSQASRKPLRWNEVADVATQNHGPCLVIWPSIKNSRSNKPVLIIYAFSMLHTHQKMIREKRQITVYSLEISQKGQNADYGIIHMEETLCKSDLLCIAGYRFRFQELQVDPNCALLYWNPETLTYVRPSFFSLGQNLISVLLFWFLLVKWCAVVFSYVPFWNRK